MGKYEERIQDAKKALTENDVKRNDLFTQLGTVLLSQKVSMDENPSLGELYQKGRSLGEVIPETLERRETLMGKLETYEETAASLKDIHGQLKAVRKEAEPYWEELGRAVFDLHRRGILVGAGLTAELNTLMDRQGEITKLENAINQRKSDSSEKNIFTKMVDKGREVVLSSNRSAKAASLTRHLKRVGELASSSDALDKVAEAGFTNAADPLLQLRDREEHLDGQRETLEKQKEIVWKSMEDLGGEGKPQQVIKSLAHKLDTLRDDLKKCSSDLGELFFREPLAALKDKKDVKDLVSRIESTEAREKSLEDLLARLYAGAEAETLEGEIQVRAAKKVKLEKERDALLERIEALHQEISEREKEKETKEKARGPESELSLDVKDLS